MVSLRGVALLQSIQRTSRPRRLRGPHHLISLVLLFSQSINLFMLFSVCRLIITCTQRFFALRVRVNSGQD